MKKMHRSILWLTVIAMVLALAGCGGNDPTTAPTTAPTTVPTTAPTTEPPLTAEQVYTSVANAMSGAEATRLRMALSYEMSVTQGEEDAAVTTDVTLDMMVDTMACAEPFGSYTLMDMAVDAGDFGMSYTIEAYIVEEEESVVTYMQMFDTWTRTDSGMSVSDFLASGQMTEVSTDEVWSGSAKPEDMTLDKDTTSLNGVEVYVLRGSIPAGDMSEAFSSLGVEDTSAYEDMTLPVVYYVDAQTFTILRMEVNMDFMVDLLDEVLAQSMVGTDTKDAKIELNIPDIVYDLEYGVPEIPAVPQEAYDYIENNPDTSGSDPEPTEPAGPLIMSVGEEALLINCPVGWTGMVFDDTNAFIYNDDMTIMVDYYYMTDTTRDDLLEQVQFNVQGLKDMENYVSHGEGPAIEGYETMQVIGNGESYYFAWREAGDGWFFVYVFDYTGTDDATELLPQCVGYAVPYSE